MPQKYLRFSLYLKVIRTLIKFKRNFIQILIENNVINLLINYLPNKNDKLTILILSLLDDLLNFDKENTKIQCEKCGGFKKIRQLSKHANTKITEIIKRIHQYFNDDVKVVESFKYENVNYESREIIDLCDSTDDEEDETEMITVANGISQRKRKHFVDPEIERKRMKSRTSFEHSDTEQSASPVEDTSTDQVISNLQTVGYDDAKEGMDIVRTNDIKSSPVVFLMDYPLTTTPLNAGE
uniref:Uncharacterized protein n=1 Tax=Panagrolaimus davidi TaxID=227884 RepID=A0A914QEQ2_9BILA